METLKELYKIGCGPSSSHTMGPRKAADEFNKQFPQAASFKVTLYGSLAATGKGHLTDFTIREAFYPKPVEILFDEKTLMPKHPNALKLEALDQAAHVTGQQVVYSIGGGAIREEHNFGKQINNVYPHKSMNEILQYTSEKRMLLWEYVEECEGPEIWDYLTEVWINMKQTIKRGLSKRGLLPGSLNSERKAQRYLYKAEKPRSTCAV